MNIMIGQAVLLCGGLGTRLKPFTDSNPKPMVRVNGKPFLDYLFDQMIENDIQRVLLLTGYMAEKISEHYGNQYKSLKLAYSNGDVSLDTAERLALARHDIEDHFLLMYADNYSSFSLKRSLAAFDSEQSLRLHLCRKSNGNITINSAGRVSCYDPLRKKPADYVELGYMLVNKERVFDYLTSISKSFTRTIVKCVEDGTVTADVSKHHYYSISDPDRLKTTEEYLKPKRIILIDRDGVINVKAPKAEYITHPGAFVVINDTIDAMQKLAELGFKFIVVSNQAGVGRGVFTQEQLNIVNNEMLMQLSNRGIDILNTYTCVHHWDEKCDCRKPKPGMLMQAASDFNLCLERCLFIGDDPRDVLAAENAGSKSVLVNCSVQDMKDSAVTPTFFAPYLSELVSEITAFYD